MSEQNAAAAESIQSDPQDRTTPMDAAARNLLYLEIRSRLRDGWDDLPEGLAAAHVLEIAAMAKARSDHRIVALCSAAVETG